MRISEFSTSIASDIYGYCGLQRIKYGEDDGYNRDYLSDIPMIVPVCNPREQTKACANLQTKNIR